MINLRAAFDEVLKGRSLNAAEAEGVIGEILDDVVPDALVAGFLVALKVKGEASAELTGGARALRKRARPLNLNDGKVLDTAGTGGDGAGTFNISTAAAMVAATAGVPVAKHGNRAISGRVGAADVLERIGVKLELDAAGLKRCLEQAGCCFVFAPAYHPALARLAVLRRTLGVRTLFNLIAPLANPARPLRQLLGVSEPRLLRPMAEALAALGVVHAMVVHGNDGLDEISVCAPTRVAELKDNMIRTYDVTPEQLLGRTARPEDLAGGDPAQNAAITRRVLEGTAGPARDVVLVNAGAAIVAAGVAADFAEGIRKAEEAIDSGAAAAKLEALIRFTQENA